MNNLLIRAILKKINDYEYSDEELALIVALVNLYSKHNFNTSSEVLQGFSQLIQKALYVEAVLENLKKDFEEGR
jgi:hypothetical protein